MDRDLIGCRGLESGGLSGQEKKSDLLVEASKQKRVCTYLGMKSGGIRYGFSCDSRLEAG